MKKENIILMEKLLRELEESYHKIEEITKILDNLE